MTHNIGGQMPSKKRSRPSAATLEKAFSKIENMNADSVACALARNHVKGRCEDATACALAQYFANLGACIVSIDGTTARAYKSETAHEDGDFYWSRDLGDLAAFVRAFDSHQYPFLEL